MKVMKKLLISIVFVIPIGIMCSSAGEWIPRTKSIETVGTVKSLRMPFASTGKAEMVMVFKKGVYTLWRCEQSIVDNYPSLGLTGKTYRYFVYKNEKPADQKYLWLLLVQT
jgi:hypothetical protein